MGKKHKLKKRRMTSDDDITSPSDELFVDTSTSTSTSLDFTLMEASFWDFLREHSTKLVEVIKQTDEWKQLEHRCEKQEQVINELQRENNDLRKRLAITEGAVTRTELALKKLDERMTDTISRSMRDNIVLKNVDEEDHENEDKLEIKVQHFFQTELKLSEENMKKITIERAHRSGDKTKGFTRNIIVKLNSKGKAIVMRHLKNLNNQSKVKITEQYPPEVHSNRSKLWPAFISAKQQGKVARWRQDKLIIDGKVKKAPVDTNTDINIDTTEAAMSMVGKHTAVVSTDNTHLQAHTVQIQSADDVIPAMKALCADARVAGATHLMYAYRTGNEKFSVHNWEDNGGFGSARYIMDVINSQGVYNKLVCVSRWGSGQHLARFHPELIKDLAKQALCLR